jgi:hypothetical protein
MPRRSGAAWVAPTARSGGRLTLDSCSVCRYVAPLVSGRVQRMSEAISKVLGGGIGDA